MSHGETRTHEPPALDDARLAGRIIMIEPDA